MGVEGKPKSNCVGAGAGAPVVVGIWMERSPDLPRLWKGSRVCAGSGGIGIGRVEVYGGATVDVVDSGSMGDLESWSGDLESSLRGGGFGNSEGDGIWDVGRESWT